MNKKFVRTLCKKIEPYAAEVLINMVERLGWTHTEILTIYGIPLNRQSEIISGHKTNGLSVAVLSMMIKNELLTLDGIKANVGVFTGAELLYLESI